MNSILKVTLPKEIFHLPLIKGLKNIGGLVNTIPGLGWIVNIEKSELEPKQIFNFVGYQSSLKGARPTLEHWQTLKLKSQNLLADPFCLIW